MILEGNNQNIVKYTYYINKGFNILSHYETMVESCEMMKPKWRSISNFPYGWLFRSRFSSVPLKILYFYQNKCRVNSEYQNYMKDKS